MRFVKVYPTTQEGMWIRKPSSKNMDRMHELFREFIEARPEAGEQYTEETHKAANALTDFMFAKVFCEENGDVLSGDNMPDRDDIDEETLGDMLAAGMEAVGASLALEAKKPSTEPTGTSPQKSGS